MTVFQIMENDLLAHHSKKEQLSSSWPRGTALPEAKACTVLVNSPFSSEAREGDGGRWRRPWQSRPGALLKVTKAAQIHGGDTSRRQWRETTATALGDHLLRKA